jgi:hypothetical protein
MPVSAAAVPVVRLFGGVHDFAMAVEAAVCTVYFEQYVLWNL